MPGSLLIRGGKLVTTSGALEVDVAVEDGAIIAVGRGLADRLRGPWAEVVDASGMLVLPGAIDEHVHTREPGGTEKEDFYTATAAAVAGGVTAIADMPNTSPPIDSAQRVMEKGESAAGRSFADYAIYAALTPSSSAELEELLAAGAIGLKAYLGPTTGGLEAPDDWAIARALALSEGTGAPVVFHAENRAIISGMSAELRAAGRRDLLAHSESRPPLSEELEIVRIATIALRVGGRAHIAHVSTAEGVDAVARYARLGAKLTAEVCPHHLLFTSDDYARLGALIKVNPPVRTRAHVEALWEAIRAGDIFSMGSDHAPHAPRDKEGDAWTAASGIPGVQTLLPAAVDAALRGLMPLEAVPRLLSENPARLLGLYPRKGAVEPGSDADLVVVDPRAEWEVREEDLLYKNPSVSPYIGMRFRGRIALTILRGEVAYDGRSPVGGPRGRWLKGSWSRPRETL